MTWINLMHTPRKVIKEKLSWYEKQKKQRRLSEFLKESEIKQSEG